MYSFVFMLICILGVSHINGFPNIEDHLVTMKLLQNSSPTNDDSKAYEIKTKKGDIYRMNLHKNDMISQHHISITTSAGHTVYQPQDCHYHGSLVNKKGGVVMNDCEGGLSGTIFTEDGTQVLTLNYDADGGKHYLHPEDSNQVNFIPQEVLESERPVYFSNNKHKFRRSIDDPGNVEKYISIAMVADTSFFNEMNQNFTQSMNYLHAVANHVDYVYKSENIRVALVHVDLWTNVDEFTVTTDIDENLRLFEAYNRDVLTFARGWKHDNAQMLIGKSQEHGVAGQAATASLCYGISSAVSVMWSDNPAVTAGTVAHELGHNFGISHSDDNCQCSRPPCTMYATSSSTPVNGLTDCSVQAIKERCESGGCLCLLDPPKIIVDGPVCGNGFTEEGEECDCGGLEDCTNPCCNASTCTKKNGAECASGKCCDNCKIKQIGNECRKAAGECDISEYCDGVNAECPENIYVYDFASCNNNEGYCHNGLCSATLTEQCKFLWGANATHGTCQINDYFMNMEGSEWGNCGTTETGFNKCSRSDVNCGKLQCYGENLPPYILFGTSRRTSSYQVDGGSECRTGTTNMGNDVGDITLAKPGTKCAENKVCYEQHCLDVASIRNTFHSKITCDGKCGNNGICTNKGKCFCNVGYQCPDCLQTDVSNNSGKLCDDVTSEMGSSSTGGEESQCMNGCSSNGVCETDKCFCFRGWKCPDCKLADPDNIYGQSCNTGVIIECSSPVPITFRSVGCSSELDNKFSKLIDLKSNIDWEDYHDSLKSILCQCASTTNLRGWKAFGIQYWGECWGNATLLESVPPSTNCKNTNLQTCNYGDDMCIGEDSSAYLYEIE